MPYGPEVLAARREAKAVQLRAARMTYQQIADYVMPCPEHDSIGGLDGCGDCAPLYRSRAGAFKAVTRVLEREYAGAAASRELLLQESLATVDAVIRRMMADTQDPRLDPADRARAATALMRAMDHRAKLTGLYAPTRVTVTDELDLEIEQMIRDLAGNPHNTRTSADQ